MSEDDKKQGEKPLEEFEVSAELATIAEQKILPQKIVQRITERLKEKNIKVTRSQLYRLVEKIQSALQSLTPSLSNHTEQVQMHVQKKTLNDTTFETNDMKKLLEAVEQLNQRIKVIEENQLRGVKGVTGTLVKTTDIKTFDPTGLLQENMQPLHHINNDPESIVIIMKWLQYLVDKVGKNNLADALGYYVDIGWISEDVRFDLINYSKGITEEYTQEEGGNASQLPAKDHIQSLLFIQKIKGVHLDDRFLNKIERDMEKIVRSLEEYQGN
jgi:archaeal flagellar protein FlaD